MKVGVFEFIFNPPAGRVNDWERRWETGVAETAAGDEHRAGWRSMPLKAISWNAHSMSLEERVGLEAAVVEALKTGKACAPYWGRGSELALDCSGTAVTLRAGSVWNWQAGDQVFLFDQEDWNGGTTSLIRGRTSWEVRGISSVTAGGGGTIVLNLSGGAVARTYKAKTLCWPLIYGRLFCEEMPLVTAHRGEPRLKLQEVDANFSKGESGCPALTNYLGRPLCIGVAGLQDFSWESDAAAKTFRYDLKELLLGFGAPDFGGTASRVVQGQDLELLLDGETAIRNWDCFTSALVGRLHGFWMREAAQLCEIQSSNGAGKVIIKDVRLRDTWNAAGEGCRHLWIPALNAAVEITAVADLGAFHEEVTFTPALTFVFGTAPEAYRLRYVRLADDRESGRFEAEGRMRRRVRVVELPEEYAGAETGEQPVQLYTFTLKTPVGDRVWRKTSFAANVTSDGDVFTAANLTHGEIRNSIYMDAPEVTLRGSRAMGEPFTLLFPHLIPLALWVKIEEATLGDLDTRETTFYGRARSAKLTGESGQGLEVKCASHLDTFLAKTPLFQIGRVCNWQLFGPGCDLDAADWNFEVTVVSVSANRRTVRVTGGGLNSATHVEGWFALGALFCGMNPADPTKYQAVRIRASEPVVDTATQDLQLVDALGASIVATNLLWIRPGCDKLWKTCKDKFANNLRFGAFGAMPDNNPALPNRTMPVNKAKK